MKRFIALFLCLCMTAALLVGCGGGAEKEFADTNTDSGKITLTYMSWSGSGQKAVEQRAIEAFNNSHPDVQIKATFVPGDYLSRIQTLIAGKKEPDICYMYGNYIHDWAQKGLLADLTPYIANSSLDVNDLLPMAAFYDQGKLYGITPTMECVLVFYNKQIFAEAGVTEEDVKDWTWEEYVEIMRKVTVDANGNHPGDSGFDTKQIQTWGTTVPTASYINEPLLWSNGGAYFEPDGSGLAIDRPESVEVLQEIVDLTFVEQVAPTSADMAGMSSTVKLLQTGKLASFFGGSFTIASFVDEGFTDYGVAPLPIFDEPANQLWGEPLVIFESCEHKEAAFEFLQYLVNPESCLQLPAEGSSIPALKSWYTDPEKFAKWADNEYHGDDFRSMITDLVMNCEATRHIYYIKNSDALGNVMWSALDRAYLNNESVESIVAELEEKAKPYLQGAWEVIQFYD